jgi:hypothetical protein
MESGASAPPAEAGSVATSTAALAAVLATLFFPLIALIAALLLQGGECGALAGSGSGT